MEELDHETGETLERSWDADGGRDLDQDTFGGMNIDLQLASLVEGRVKQREKTLALWVSMDVESRRC